MHADGTLINIPDEKGTVVSKATIMNQSTYVKPLPDAIKFSFLNQAAHHLWTHPTQKVKPGGSFYCDCNEEHGRWHTSEACT